MLKLYRPDQLSRKFQQYFQMLPNSQRFKKKKKKKDLNLTSDFRFKIQPFFALLDAYTIM